jgi:hypothetical protein
MPNNNQSGKQHSKQFLIEEYEMLRELRRDLQNVQESRLTAFMAEFVSYSHLQASQSSRVD